MSKAEELVEILKGEIIPEIENIIDDMFEDIAENKDVSEEEKAELKEAQEMKKEFEEMVLEAQAGDMDEDESAENLLECKEILKEIKALDD